jgi:hypothetical protein
MASRLRAFAVALALAAVALGFPAVGLPQTAVTDATALQVQSLAPQLVAFAGSAANFQSLVHGLSLGVPVTLVTFTADGLTQTVAFTPSTTMSAANIARTLEAARQQLIARGIANPTAEQIGVTLAGGNLPTPAGAVQVSAMVPTLAPGGLQGSAAAGASARTPPGGAALGTASPGSNIVIDIRPAAAQPASGSASSPTTASGTSVSRNVSDTNRTSNTSDTPAPSTNAPAAAPGVGITPGVVMAPGSTRPALGSTAPGSSAAGGLSPATQIQNRR